MSTAVKTAAAPRWDLDSIFPGGSASKEYKAFRDKARADLKQARAKLDNLPEELSNSSAGAWTDFILQLQSLLENIDLIRSFAGCLTSQNTDDTAAQALETEGDFLSSEWEKLRTGLEALSLRQSDQAWEKLVTSDKLKEIRFYLDELREIAKSKMSEDQESLALDLAVTGYHGWNRLYDKIAGDIRVDFTEKGETKKISMGQVATKFAHPDRNIRRQAFEKMTEGWESQAELAAMALNSQAGFRLALYNHREWDSVLFEPLMQARLSREALEAMWSVISQEFEKLAPYVKAKKKLLGIDKFRWYDEFASVGAVDKEYRFDEAVDFVEKHVGEFSPELAKFVRMAVDKRWVEAEDRAGKRGGAFCTGTGPHRQTRVFMTFAGTFDNLLTLAHELGHAYHNWVLRDRAFFATEYPMTLAETASIFNEMLVTDAALQVAADRDEKLMLLEQKLQQAYVLFCDIHTRYLFDLAFYAERKDGPVSKDRLCEMMIESQKKAFGTLLDESGYHPLFWASKLHFYITDNPFYNYPYTFGFLFAGGVYDRARKEGRAFAEKYKALLADSGSMTTDQAAKKHLGVDLAKEEFWKDAVARSLGDVDEFVKLAG
jgi:pepF/M3 family oligoendopeptidase